MKIKITDAKKLIAALEAVNQGASSHTAGIAEIMGLELDKKLAALLPKKEWKGSRASYMSGGRVPSAYKWQRAVTLLEFQRGASQWFVVGMIRTSILGNADPLNIFLTPAQRDAAVARFSRQFSVSSIA
jgi:hypothetical protein